MFFAIYFRNIFSNFFLRLRFAHRTPQALVFVSVSIYFFKYWNNNKKNVISIKTWVINQKKNSINFSYTHIIIYLDISNIWQPKKIFKFVLMTRIRIIFTKLQRCLSEWLWLFRTSNTMIRVTGSPAAICLGVLRCGGKHASVSWSPHRFLFPLVKSEPFQCNLYTDVKTD